MYARSDSLEGIVHCMYGVRHRLVCNVFLRFVRFVGRTTGSKTYYFKDDLAHLEEALVCFTLDTLLKKYVSRVQEYYHIIICATFHKLG